MFALNVVFALYIGGMSALNDESAEKFSFKGGMSALNVLLASWKGGMVEANAVSVVDASKDAFAKSGLENAKRRESRQDKKGKRAKINNRFIILFLMIFLL